MLRVLSTLPILSLALRVWAASDSYLVNAVCTWSASPILSGLASHHTWASSPNRTSSDQLMREYSSSSGIWGNSWWESANMMSAFADLATLDPDYGSIYSHIFASTYANAPSSQGHANFLDDYYDDEGWWGLAWLNVYRLTNDADYLNAAITIFDDMRGGWTTPCGGGIYWEKSATYIASIANALFIQLGAGLANSVSPDEKLAYLDAATAGWDWFFNIGVVNTTTWYVVDGVDGTTCKPTGNIYTYNQAVILGAAAELYEATGNSTYLDLAGNIATAVTTPNAALTTANDILVDDCDRSQSCSGNGLGFKGPFVKNLRKLYLARPNPQWSTFLQTNAQSIWNNALNVTNSDCLLGEYWAGSDSAAATSAISQGIALDALVAAFAVTP